MDNRESVQNKTFKSVIVSTDDKKIAEVSKNFGAEIAYPRPASISDDQSTVVEVVKALYRGVGKIRRAL